MDSDEVATHSGVIMMLNVMIVTLKAGYQMFFRLSHILNFAGCTRDQIDDVYFDHTAIQSICSCHLCL